MLFCVSNITVGKKISVEPVIRFNYIPSRDYVTFQYEVFIETKKYFYVNYGK